MKVTAGPFVFGLDLGDVRVSTPAKGSGKVVMEVPEQGAELIMTPGEAEELIEKLRPVIQEARVS